MIEQLSMELDLFFSDPPAEAEMLSITLPYLTRPFTAPVAPEEGVYWHCGELHTRMLAIGDAWSVELQGDQRMDQAEAAFSQLQRYWSAIDPEEQGHAPRLYLQYAFDANDPMAQEWNPWPNTLLQLPRLQLINQKGQQLLIFSHPITAEHTANTILQQWEEDLSTLQAILEQNAPPLHSPLQSETSNESLLPLLTEAVDAVVDQPPLEKLVIGTAQTFQTSSPLPLQSALQQLEKKHRKGTQLLYTSNQQALFAAPPEQLLHCKGNQLYTESVAGTVPKGESPEDQQRYANRLLHNEKLREEHQLVTDFICDQLHDQQLNHGIQPEVHLMDHVQHLRTPLNFTITRPTSLFQLVKQLHQSPAICGTAFPTPHSA